MRIKTLLLTLTLIFSLVLTGCAVERNDVSAVVETSVIQTAANQTADYDNNTSYSITPRAADTVTMRDIALFLMDKNEHYPLSDEFIERYQQTSGGYLDTAKKAGILVDKQQHSPNQKWHFFESWLYPSIEDGTLTWDADAKSRVYTKLLCPELLLWIYEASGVDPVKVKAAKEVAEQGKSAKTSTTTIAKNMRGCVSWEDMKDNILNYKSDALTVTANQSDGFNVTGLKLAYEKGNEVSFTVNVKDDTKEIAEVKANDVTLTAVSGSAYKFEMPDQSVVITVTLRDIPVGPTVTLDRNSVKLTVGEQTAITATVSDDVIDSATWSITAGEGIVKIIPRGNQATIEALAKGTATITVNYGYLSAECSVTVREQGDVSLIPSQYDVIYDLGNYKTARPISDNEALMNTLQLNGEGDGLIDSVQSFANIYGGGNGGSGESKWYTGDMLKLGTTSVNGSFTVNLNAQVNRVIITGYVSNNTCKLQVGDSASTDWTNEANDNKTATVTCSEMNAVTKEIVENGQTALITIDFESTDSLTIATANKKPFYITSIEFLYVD